MGIFSEIFCSAEKELASELVSRLAKELPPKFLNDGNAKLSVNKITRALERVYYVASEFRGEKRWGIYRRSVFANAFKWGLKERGYSNKFVDLAVEGIIVELAKKALTDKQPRT